MKTLQRQNYRRHLSAGYWLTVGFIGGGLLMLLIILTVPAAGAHQVCPEYALLAADPKVSWIDPALKYDCHYARHHRRHDFTPAPRERGHRMNVPPRRER